jgi:hypothetical protein
MRTLLAAGLAGLLLLGHAFAASPEERYAQAAALLALGCRGNGCDFGVETTEEQAALGAMWQATQDWTIAWLAGHPDWSLDRRRSALLNWNVNNLNRVAPADIIQLRRGLYAFFAQYGEMGNVFLVEQRPGRFAVVWDIRNADPGAFPILKAWRTDHDNGACRTADDTWADQCGPLFANVIVPLPPDEKGRARFYLNATYAQAAETTVGAQLSVWSLDGTMPKIQWAKNYAYNFEDVSLKLDGTLLKVRTTDWWHTIYACGSCVGRQMDWTLRIRPDGVDDLGMKPVVPEMDAFDQLAWAVFQKRDARDLATPEVIALMKKSVGDEKAALDDLDKDHALGPDYFSFSMLAGFEVRQVSGGTELCVITDEVGLRVRFERRGERLFATDLAQLPDLDSKSCHKSPG